MAVSFIPAAEVEGPLPLSLGISGASGTGKTYSALRVARGIARELAGSAAKIGFVDTENRRALHYRDAFPEMVHLDLSAVDASGQVIGYPWSRWIEVLETAERLQLPALVVDSYSHAWEGVGGVLEQQARILDRMTGGNASRRDQLSQIAWAQVKPDYRRLVERIVRTSVPIILCTRAKRVIQDPKTKLNLRETKTRRADVPFDIAADGDLLFEMTAQVILDPRAPGHPVHLIKLPDELRTLFKPDRPMDEALGRDLARWSLGKGEGAKNKATMEDARERARRGSDVLRAYWQTLDADAKAVLRTIQEELKAKAQEADRKAEEPDDPLAGGNGSERRTEPEQDNGGDVTE